LRILTVFPNLCSVTIQPLVTSAFSSIYVQPLPYGARRTATVGDAPVPTTRRAEEATEYSAARWADRTKAVEDVQGTRKSESLWPTRDAGKPMSASGDLLDLSDAAKLHDSTKDSKISVRQDDSNAEKTEKPLQSASLNTGELTSEEQKQVAELKAQDTNVRAHEAAHLAAAGPYATSGASFTYETGPDGKKYAVGGEVSISTSPVKGNPQATLEKAQTIQRAALAPAQPSSQDYKVAATAAQMAAEAQRTIVQQKAVQPQESEGTEQSDAAFRLVRGASSPTAATPSASSPAAYYATQSRMAANAATGFTVYA